MIKWLDACIESAVLDAVDVYAAQHDLGCLMSCCWSAIGRNRAMLPAGPSARDGVPHGCHEALITLTEAALKRIGARVLIMRR